MMHLECGVGNVECRMNASFRNPKSAIYNKVGRGDSKGFLFKQPSSCPAISSALFLLISNKTAESAEDQNLEISVSSVVTTQKS